MEAIQYEIPMKEKIVVSPFATVNVVQVQHMMENMQRELPELQRVFESIEEIHFLNDEESYRKIFDSLFDKEGWGRLAREQFYHIYSFQKNGNYSVHGLSFERTIVINLSQIEESVAEYGKYLSSEEHIQRRNRRYYEKDSGYEHFESFMKTEEDCRAFFFWHSLFKQIASIGESVYGKNSRYADLTTFSQWAFQKWAIQ